MARPSLTSLLAPGAFDRPVDQVGADERAAKFTKRSIKTSSKLQGLKMVVSMTDLTTLEGKDSPGKVRQMCAKAIRPDPRERRIRAGPREHEFDGAEVAQSGEFHALFDYGAPKERCAIEIDIVTAKIE